MTLDNSFSKDQSTFVSQLVFSSILVFLFMSQLERFLTMIFVLNFSTAGPNVTVLLIFLLLTGFIEVVLPWPHTERMLSICLVLMAVMIIVSFLPITLLATLAAIGALIFLTPLFISRIQVEKHHFALSSILGILIQIAFRTWLDTASYYATLLGAIILLVCLGVGIFLWFVKIKNNLMKVSIFTSASPVMGFLFIQYLFLGFPNVVSTWYFRNYFILTVVCVIGLVIGAFLILEKGPQIAHSKWVLGWIGLYLISLIDLLWIDLLPLATYFLVQMSGCIVLYSGLKSSSISSSRSMAIRMTGVQLLLVLTLFLQVSAGNWAFMPSLLEFTRGQASTMIFITGLFLPISSLTINLSKHEIKRSQGIRSAFRIICLIIIVLSTGGIIFYEVFTPVRSPNTNKLNVMNFNIHQYFSIAQTGLYNLEQVRDVILDSRADVVGLQESEGARITSSNMNGVQWLAHQTGMKYYYYGPPTSAQIYGVSLLSRYPILNPRYVNLPSEQSIERVAIVAEIETGTLAGQLPIIVTHFQTNRYSEDRFAQAQTIVNLSQNFASTIILGDFNTRPNSTDQAFTLLNSTFSDAWILAGNNPLEGATSYLDDGIAVHRIDYIWLKGSWTVLRCDTFGSTRASDHRAVYAELLLD